MGACTIPPNKAKCEARAIAPFTENLKRTTYLNTTTQDPHNSSISDTPSKPSKTQNQIPGQAGYDTEVSKTTAQ
jgi:hypothetical protein